jgi:hypothetical protein
MSHEGKNSSRSLKNIKMTTLRSSMRKQTRRKSSNLVKLKNRLRLKMRRISRRLRTVLRWRRRYLKVERLMNVGCLR